MKGNIGYPIIQFLPQTTQDSKNLHQPLDNLLRLLVKLKGGIFSNDVRAQKAIIYYHLPFRSWTV